MRKIIIGALLFVLLVAGPAESQEEFVLYLPLIASPPLEYGVIPMAGNWNVIEKEATTNLVSNPSFENNITDGWVNYNTGAAAGNRAQSSVRQRYGVYSLFLEKTGGAVADRWGQYISIGNSVLNESYIAHCWVYVGTGATANMLLFKNAGVGILQEEKTTTTTGGRWVYLETGVMTANATGDAMRVYLYVTGTPTISVRFDAVQAENKGYETTYADGDQEGCEWNGAEHDSTSTRSAISLAGGRVREFEVVYSFFVDKMIQIGAEPQELAFDEYAILPGGELNAVKSGLREFVLAGTITGTSLADLHVNRQALLEVLRPDVPGGQPIRLRYDGAAVEKEISCYYADGLDGDIRAVETGIEARERIAVRFMAADPFFYEIGESAAALDFNDAAGARYIIGRLKSTGQWDDLGLTANPATGGEIRAILYASDNTVYVGGTFTNMDAAGGRDYVARYIPLTDTWETVGAGASVNGTVYTIAEGPDGTIYIGGAFTNVGDANGDLIAKWNGAAWSSLAVMNYAAGEIVYDLKFDHSGNLIIGGLFTALGAVGAANGIAGWNGAAFYAIGAPAVTPASYIYTIGIDSQDNYYFGGSFTNLGGVGDADNLGWWNGTAYAALGGVTPNQIVYAIVVDSDDTIIIGGNFTDLGGDGDLDYLVRYTGSAYIGFGTAPNAVVYALAIAPDGTLLAGGNFTSVGGLNLPDRIARWRGNHWAYFDVDFVGTPLVYAIAVGPPDPVISTNFDIYVAPNTTGAASLAGKTTVSNDGTQSAFPRVRIKRVAGGSAILYTMRNETTGKELLFNAYTFLDGETLTVYLEPTQKRVISSYFGPRPDAILPNSDFGEFVLIPGDNEISLFVSVTGGLATVDQSNIIFKDTYASLD